MQGKGSIAGLEFHVVDTPGLDDADQEDSISKQLQV
jgi:predicted GTPase